MIDIVPIKGCKNLVESYGEICVKCNKCGRFDNYCCDCKKLSIDPATGDPYCLTGMDEDGRGTFDEFTKACKWFEMGAKID